MKKWLRKWLGVEASCNDEKVQALKGELEALKKDVSFSIHKLSEATQNHAQEITKILDSMKTLIDSTNKLGDVTQINSKEIAKINAGLSVLVKNLQKEADEKAAEKPKTEKKPAAKK